MKRLSLIIILVVSANLFSQNPIYSGKHFTIYNNKIVEGDKIAEIISPQEITTTYTSALVDGFDRLVKFKFAINGEDNERPSGMDHEVYLNPENGIYTTPLFIFGEIDPVGSGLPQGKENKIIPGEKFDVIFRVDMRKVLADLNEKGFFTCFDGTKIPSSQFEGLYLAGGTAPLSWDFGEPLRQERYKLSDDDGDGIYTVTISFLPTTYRELNGETGVWKLKHDISDYSRFTSTIPLLEAMYNLSLEELQEDIRDDGAFMAGAKWHGVWTRDISYSILLSLAAVSPDASITSLRAKVKGSRIIQDTGTGGSWPVSSDRMTWVLAAWEVYLVTGDAEWLKEIYPVIKNSIDSDLKTLYNEKSGLASGESSFLDWREQSYPEWMDPRDIFTSKNLGTNIVHYQAMKILANISELQGESGKKYSDFADKLAEAINNHLWKEDRGYYGQFLYGRNYPVLSEKSESLGESLAILTSVADKNQASRIIEETPVTEYGPTCFYPQISNIPPYHNDAVWPFVAAFRAWSSARVKNTGAVNHAFASIYRPAALFLTNKENFVASDGDFNGTQINSNRQLWSVAGNISTMLRVIFGLEYSKEGLNITPFVPKEYDGTHKITNLKYRSAIINLEVNGFGDNIRTAVINGKNVDKIVIPPDASGNINIKVTLNNELSDGKINLVENYFAPATPKVNLVNNRLVWDINDAIVGYQIFLDGEYITTTESNNFEVIPEDYLKTYQVRGVDKEGYYSFMSEPVDLFTEQAVKYLNFENGIKITPGENANISFDIPVERDGNYALDFYYSNGTGPINTDNNCGIRSVKINEKEKVVVFPQRGINQYENYGYSNSINVNLDKGNNQLLLTYQPYNKNMDGEINEAIIYKIRIIRLK